MSKSRSIIFLAALALAGSLVFAWYAMGQGTGQQQDPLAPVSYLTIPRTLTDGLPNVFWRVDRSVCDSKWCLFGLWIKYKGLFYHAHAWRVPKAATNIWIIDGHSVVVNALQRWANSTVNRTAGVKGPLPLRNLAAHSAQCKQVGPATLVGVGTDAGTLAPGVYPDSGVVSCQGWWLLQNRFGGRPAYLTRAIQEAIDEPDVDAGIPQKLDSGVPPPTGGSAVELLPNNPNFAVPDASLYKYCGQVPVGVSCP